MQDKLINLRNKITEIDKEISKNLRKRQKIVEEIGKIKKKSKLPIQDKEYEKEKLEKLPSDYEKSIFKKILSQSRKTQQEL